MSAAQLALQNTGSIIFAIMAVMYIVLIITLLVHIGEKDNKKKATTTAVKVFFWITTILFLFKYIGPLVQMVGNKFSGKPVGDSLTMVDVAFAVLGIVQLVIGIIYLHPDFMKYTPHVMLVISLILVALSGYNMFTEVNLDPTGGLLSSFSYFDNDEQQPYQSSSYEPSYESYYEPSYQPSSYQPSYQKESYTDVDLNDASVIEELFSL